MTTEFIYNIKNIFSNGVGSVFYTTKMDTFYIGPYQRSYKWKSMEKFDQVPQLLNDIYDAWHNAPDSEYFLQYITVKADNAYRWLEVIDGQQRLTTLSLLFYQLGQLDGNENIAIDKLIYSRYHNGNVFTEICDYCRTHDEVDTKDFVAQDKYYMAAASLYIKNRLEVWNADHTLNDIIKYLLNQVKIIVNIESNFVQSEEIFANLNDNHVPLTDAYLIKGLLITNAVCRTNAYGRSLEYSEIQEKRKNLGQMWDEIQTWISDAEHSHFFFKHTAIGVNYSPKFSMEYFLELAFLYKYEKERKKVVGDYSLNRLELFNKYNSVVKSNEETRAMIETIRHIYRKLVTIYESTLYNYWGFVQFSRSLNKEEGLDIYSCLSMSEKELKHYLVEMCVKKTPNLNDATNYKENYAAFRYSSRNDRLTNLLLSFSVFLPMRGSNGYRFRFYDYENSKWSFEHISPQNPKGSITVPDYAKMYVINEINKKLEIIKDENEKTRLEDVSFDVSQGVKVNSNDIEFLFDQSLDEHSLGNMALLTREDNSANNNNPFMIKKLIIQNRKGNGAFIPNHTYEVFNKILVSPCTDKPFTPQSFIWSQKDVEAHISWMVQSNELILNWLKILL